MNKFFLCLTSIFCAAAVLLLAAPLAHSMPAAPLEDPMQTAILSALAKKYPGSKIELNGAIRWARGEATAPQIIRILSETGRGELHFMSGSDQGAINYSVWVPALVALKRIQPGEKLSQEQFISQEINLASGPAFDYRGVILKDDTLLSGMETRQSILEGGFLQSTAIQRVPSIRRGDSVRIQVQSGALVLTTLGTAEEPSYLGESIRVLTAKSKRELVGKLREGGLVEVAL